MRSATATALGHGDRLQIDSVVDRVYDEIRGMILRGDVEPGARLAQAELADMLGISRTPVREALRRLTGEGLAEFRTNRGFYAANLGLDAVLHRLEVRLLLEPGIAWVAAERRSDADLAALRDAIAREARARTTAIAHDASRDFHVALAGASGNDELARVLDSLWIVEVGRRLLARRSTAPSWQESDVREHEAILAAVERGDAEAARALMQAHVRQALEHWAPEAGAARDGAG